MKVETKETIYEVIHSSERTARLGAVTAQQPETAANQCDGPTWVVVCIILRVQVSF
jgi:hypothetical protein